MSGLYVAAAEQEHIVMYCNELPASLALLTITTTQAETITVYLRALVLTAHILNTIVLNRELCVVGTRSTRESYSY